MPEEELEFHYSKDPKAMTMQESLEEMGRLLRWNRMSPEERRAELEAQKAATRATEQAARDMPCTMEPESAPDIQQGAVLDEVLDNPPGVDRVLDGVSGDTPERIMDTAPDSVPDDGPDTTEEAVPEPAEFAGGVLYQTGSGGNARGGAHRNNRAIGTDRRGRPGGERAMAVCLGIDR